jgi:hypothetical protein
MPKKKLAKKKAVKKQTAKKSPTQPKRAKKQTKKQVATTAKKSVPRFPSASELEDLREEHIAKLVTLAQGTDDPPGACVTVDSSGRMSCRITRQSMCSGPNSKFFPGKACPA